MASYLGKEANAHFKLLSLLLPTKEISFRSQEFSIVILCNILRQAFPMFRHETSTCLDIPLSIFSQDLSHHPDFVQVLVSLFQYLIIWNDSLVAAEDFDEEQDIIEHNFELIPKVLVIIASTLNPDLLGKAVRYLFSVLELASETSDPYARIGKDKMLSVQAFGCLNEGLKQALENQDSRTSFLLLEISAASLELLSDVESEENSEIFVLDSDLGHEFCDTITKVLKQDEEIDMNTIKSCAKVCCKLWASSCHLDSFELISKLYLAEKRTNSKNNADDDTTEPQLKIILEVIEKCLKFFLTLHSDAILNSPEVLQLPVINDIVGILLVSEKNE